MFETNFFTKILNFFQRIVESLENKKVNLVTGCIAVLAFSYLRCFLENFSAGQSYISEKYVVFFFLHFPFFYFAAFLLFILLGYLLTKEKIEKISKASLGLLPIILLAPIFEMLVFQGEHTISKYVEPVGMEKVGVVETVVFFLKSSLFGPLGFLNFGEYFPFFEKYTSLFSPNYIINYGIKIEVILILIFFALYIFLKTRNIFKVWIALFFSQLILFLVGYIPYMMINFLKPSGANFSLGNVSKLNPQIEWDHIIVSFCLVIFIFVSLWWFYFYDKRKLFAFMKNLRLPRLGMYLASFWYGVYLAKIPFSFSFFDWIILILANLAITLSWMFAVGHNDIADEKADKISNPSRPLISGAINKEEARSINIILRVLSYIVAFLAGYAFFITIFVRSCISYLYSNEPFRLKKYPIISTFCLASAVTLGIMGGYLILDSNSIHDFPGRLAGLILIIFTLSMNVIHIKDYEGDKEDGVKTIPVIFGLEKGKTIVGILSGFSFLLPPLFYQEYFNELIIPSVLCSIVAFFLINRQNFKEWPVLLLYYAYTLPVMFYIY